MKKTRLDLANAWLRKADSDFANAETCLKSRTSLDTACFHCQQAAEKWLKAYLLACDIPFPFVHDLIKLLNWCASRQQEFASLEPFASTLNPFAVTMRYDEDFWPDENTVAEAILAARAFRAVVMRNWPEN